jgi:hypothetical protein
MASKRASRELSQVEWLNISNDLLASSIYNNLYGWGEIKEES